MPQQNWSTGNLGPAWVGTWTNAAEPGRTTPDTLPFQKVWADEQRAPLVLDPGPSSGETLLLSPSGLSFSVWTMVFSAPWCLNPPVLLVAQEKTSISSVSRR